MTQNNPLFIETIRWSDGKFHLLELHRRRMERTRLEVFGSACGVPDLTWLPPVPENLKNQTVKCRVIYDIAIRSVEFEPYAQRKVGSLKIVDGGASTTTSSITTGVRSQDSQGCEVMPMK